LRSAALRALVACAATAGHRIVHATHTPDQTEATMKTFAYFLIAITLTSSVLADKIEKDIPYSDPPVERNVLDVYAPDDAKNLPVVFWIHGGGWQTGDKSKVALKPKVFVEKGYVFVSTNYRLFPNVDMETIHADCAKALGWTYKNIAKYGGDPNRIVVGGHSAGAELAALLCADFSYIKAAGVPRTALKACIPVDGDTYDIPLQIEVARAARKPEDKATEPKFGHYMKFGADPAKHKNFSTINHLAREKGIPPYFVLYVADNVSTTRQAEILGKKLKEAGIETLMFGAKDTNHSKVDNDIGLADDPATKALFPFLAKAVGK
jgi:arylformamidase